LTEGIILLSKPAGQTSFQSLGEVKRRLGTGRVGHAGTLDKFAEGLLVVLAGRMTRLSAFATSMDKEYVAVVYFGRTTDTLDPEGRETGIGTVPSRAEVEGALINFRGTILQTPPAYSAVHVDGKRAYKSARAGEPLVIPSRRVTIDKLELVDFTSPEATLRVSCSKGTYIRSLARDIAQSLGTCAFVTRLCRVRIGGFLLEMAKPPDLFNPQTDLLPPERFFEAAPGFGRLTVKESWVSRVGNGFPLEAESFEIAPDEDGLFGAFSHAGRLLAVIEKLAGGWRYAASFPEIPTPPGTGMNAATPPGAEGSGRERPDECRNSARSGRERPV
jgi:tRNA pseudouridine55 synthase